MSSHHKECDDYFAKAEALVADGNWSDGIELWEKFANELELHFTREETVLFPEFEEVTGMTGGPTQMMRMEHEQMRALVNEINKASQNKETEQFLALSETLMVTMQQHNMKEEQILYPLTDNALSNAVEIIEQMRKA